MCDRPRPELAVVVAAPAPDAAVAGQRAGVLAARGRRDPWTAPDGDGRLSGAGIRGRHAELPIAVVAPATERAGRDGASTARNPRPAGRPSAARRPARPPWDGRSTSPLRVHPPALNATAIVVTARRARAWFTAPPVRASRPAPRRARATPAPASVASTPRNATPPVEPGASVDGATEHQEPPERAADSRRRAGSRRWRLPRPATARPGTRASSP